MIHVCHLCEREPDEEPGWLSDAWNEWVVCPRCIRLGAALVANVEKQDYGLGGPITAYWDQRRQCQYCEKDYLFTADEQRFWYEERKFFVESAPVACVECRRTLRNEARAGQILGKMGQASKDCSWEELEQRAELAYQSAAPQQAVEYLRRAKNRCTDSEQKTRLNREIDEWLERPPTRLERKGWRTSRYVEQLEMHYRELPKEQFLSWTERKKRLPK